MSNKFICIHGHFYQPPRENAWLEEIEIQESAYPFHDWNERITSECYGPNATSRILNGEGQITDIVNNYSKISFNFGATLLHWMEEHAPDVYHLILKADAESMERFNGHGSAMAQVYNHIIMPLANREDKITQVQWGLADFEKRFKRKAEGMWLAETAVDLDSLEILVDHGISFTVLAPGQAKCFRKTGESQWQNGIDTKRGYKCILPSGRDITIFFYDGAASQAVAFKGLLEDGKAFGKHLINSFDDRQEQQLVNIATDGESYGHHHKHGDMALAYCLQYIEQSEEFRLTNYSEYMKLFPAEYEVEIVEQSSWSCAHGVERWRSDCGCSNGEVANSHQQWREPLRASLDWLRDQCSEVYMEETSKYTNNPSALRNAYIDVILDRSKENISEFFNTFFDRKIEPAAQTRILRLLEMQRHALLMFTSCAWFFDEVSRIETVQVLQYADRAIQLLENVSGKVVLDEFLERLSHAESNLPEYTNAADIYKKLISPQRLTLTKVGMHYAVNTLFDDRKESLSVLNYDTVSKDFHLFNAGVQKLAIGHTSIHSKITLSNKEFYFVVLHMGQHQVTGNASDDLSLEEFREMIDPLKSAFLTGNLALVLEIIQYYFKSKNFSFYELLRDEQLKVMNKILEENIKLAENSYTRINNTNYNLLTVMHDSKLKLPQILIKNLEIVVDQGIKRAFAQKTLDISELAHYQAEIVKWNLTVDKETIGYLATRKLKDLIQAYNSDMNSINLLIQIIEVLKISLHLKLNLTLHDIQNQVFNISKYLSESSIDSHVEFSKRQKVLDAFVQLCKSVNIAFHGNLISS